VTVHVQGIWRHLFGLLVAAIAIAVIVLIWEYALDYLNGTPFEELRYAIFGVVVIGLLSGLNALMTKLM